MTKSVRLIACMIICLVASVAHVPAQADEIYVVEAPYPVAEACYKVPVVMWIQKCEEFAPASSGVLVAGGSKVSPAVEDKVAPTWTPYIGMMGTGTIFTSERAGRLEVSAVLEEVHLNNHSSSSVCLRFGTTIECADEIGTRSLEAVGRISSGQPVKVLVTAETVYPGAASAVLRSLRLTFVPDEVVGTS